MTIPKLLALDENHAICLSVEVEVNLYAQIMIFDKTGKATVFHSLSESKYIEEIKRIDSVKQNWDDRLTSLSDGNGSEHPDWVYLPLLDNGQPTQLKDYKNMDEDLFRLFKDDQLEAAVKKNVPAIKNLLDKVH